MRPPVPLLDRRSIEQSEISGVSFPPNVCCLFLI